MYVHWREREHEEISALVREDPNVVAALMQCGLLKLFLCPFMRAQPRLMNALVDYWHLDAEAFMLEGQSLVPTTEDILVHIQITQLDKCRTYLSLVASVVTPVQLVTNVASWS
jgi:hypothetical protein